jgi:hypothetical protein
MSGAKTKADYVSDNGTTYTTSYPTWLFNLFTAPSTASTTTMPRGMKKRRRYFKVNATGKEGSFPVWSAADPLYTGAFGVAVTTEIGAYPGATGLVSKTAGRTGERDKNI